MKLDQEEINIPLAIVIVFLGVVATYFTNLLLVNKKIDDTKEELVKEISHNSERLAITETQIKMFLEENNFNK